jgi:hypothetical protein
MRYFFAILQESIQTFIFYLFFNLFFSWKTKMENKGMENNKVKKMTFGKQKDGKQKWKTRLNTYLLVK